MILLSGEPQCRQSSRSVVIRNSGPCSLSCAPQPVSGMIFTTGLGYYLYTYLTAGRFTNMSALLFTTAVTIFLMGLVSEQITSLIYMKNKHD